jgi:hypothetical protein
VTEHVPSHDQLPLGDYDHLPTGSLVGRLRSLTAEELATVRAYEAAHANRVQVMQLIDARAGQLADGAEPTGGSPDAARPETAGTPDTPSKASPQTEGPPINPPSHGDPTNPAQPRS